eukprot:COSAG01_NODE_1220_length_11162_cov_107.350176_7_plen_44_part_00
MDRGIATKENIDLIKELNFPYTVIQRANNTSLSLERSVRLVRL